MSRGSFEELKTTTDNRRNPGCCRSHFSTSNPSNFGIFKSSSSSHWERLRAAVAWGFSRSETLHGLLPIPDELKLDLNPSPGKSTFEQKTSSSSSSAIRIFIGSSLLPFPIMRGLLIGE